MNVESITDDDDDDDDDDEGLDNCNTQQQLTIAAANCLLTDRPTEYKYSMHRRAKPQ